MDLTYILDFIEPRSGIPSKQTKTDLPNNIEGLFLDINKRKKCLLFAGYNSNKENISSHLNDIGTSLDRKIGIYDDLLLIGDFNSQIEEVAMKDFCAIYSLTNLIEEPTCFKNSQNPTTIDMILINKPQCFQDSLCIETGISDHHKKVTTVLKVYFKKENHIKIKYRNYIKFLPRFEN